MQMLANLSEICNIYIQWWVDTLKKQFPFNWCFANSSKTEKTKEIGEFKKDKLISIELQYDW